jgi:hypothetical protein
MRSKRSLTDKEVQQLKERVGDLETSLALLSGIVAARAAKIDQATVPVPAMKQGKKAKPLTGRNARIMLRVFDEAVSPITAAEASHEALGFYSGSHVSVVSELKSAGFVALTGAKKNNANLLQITDAGRQKLAVLEATLQG